MFATRGEWLAMTQLYMHNMHEGTTTCTGYTAWLLKPQYYTHAPAVFELDNIYYTMIVCIGQGYRALYRTQIYTTIICTLLPSNQSFYRQNN